MRKKSAAQLVRDYAMISVGCVLYAVGFRFFMYPNDIITGGLTGVSMIINYLTGWPVGVMVIVMNVPLFIAAWRSFGTGYMLASLAGMGISSLLVDLFALLDFAATDDILLGCVFGGVLMGAGLGLIFQAGASTGGIDIMAKYVRRRLPHLNFGTIMMALDVLVVIVFALIFKKYEAALYAVITNYILSKAIDGILYGITMSKVCYIISDKSREIAAEINETLGRGVTLLHGEGGYTGNAKMVVMCVIKSREIVDVRAFIKAIDPEAFMIVSDTKDVFGDGFGDIHGD